MLKMWHLHYLDIERWIIVELIMQHQGMVIDRFNPLIQLSKFLLDLRILDDIALQLLGRSLAWSQAIP